ncbi:unnamed protein product [Allacma fusca]|uniref:Uncharacterized protein n=1 Tax=Allacma fusca TaxID=39272 RepID=A0A8J2KB46_9HEXA|nr:unnamed protein product [Allacma fusca]
MRSGTEVSSFTACFLAPYESLLSIEYTTNELEETSGDFLKYFYGQTLQTLSSLKITRLRALAEELLDARLVYKLRVKPFKCNPSIYFPGDGHPISLVSSKRLDRSRPNSPQIRKPYTEGLRPELTPQLMTIVCCVKTVHMEDTIGRLFLTAERFIILSQKDDVPPGNGFLSVVTDAVGVMKINVKYKERSNVVKTFVGVESFLKITLHVSLNSSPRVTRNDNVTLIENVENFLSQVEHDGPEAELIISFP